MLQIKNICKSYRTQNFNQIALDNVTISFRDNEFAAILGPSGSGKTTLLNIIGGLDHYDSGDLIIDGISTKQYKSSDWDTFRNNRIGFVFQSYNLISHQSVLKNVELALTLSGIGKSERERRAREVLERVGLKEHINKKPSQLSGGQMQRVAIARALINDPEILLADEPTGALDSQTSIEVMDLLKEIANERLVIMVTHNPELAEKYATRIVNLKDGKIAGDTSEFSPSDSDLMTSSKKKIRRASMNFLTALSLSFNNLMSKKGRTIITAFAGSIGIIGIAAILALSNGTNEYIKDVEEDTLTSYPVQVNKSGFDLSSMITTADDSSSNNNSTVSALQEESDVKDTPVGQQPIINNMLKKMTNNDLKSLKEWIESDDGSSLRDSASYINYQYNVTPQIYLKGKTDTKYRKVNPDNSFSSLGMGSSAVENSTLSSMMSTNVFNEMEDKSLLEDSYELKYGKWPENKNECILCVSENGKVLDYTLYQLGLRNYSELKEIVKAVTDEQEIDVPEDENSYTYKDFLDIEMKCIVNADTYQKDGTYNVWVDKSEDEAYMNDLIENKSETIKITGIVSKKEGARAEILTAGCIYYSPELVTDTIEKASNTDIVKEQIANPNIDVFSGSDFDDESSSSMDMQNLITIDEDAISAAFKFDASSLNLNLESINTSFDGDDIGSALPAIDASALSQELSKLGSPVSEQGVATLIAGLINDYISKAGQYESIEAYLASDDAKAVMQNLMPGVIDGGYNDKLAVAIQNYMSNYMQKAMVAISMKISSSLESSLSQIQSQLANSLSNAISIDKDAFSNAFKINMDQEELQATVLAMISNGGTSTCESNLTKLGYMDLSSPSSIEIYAKDFDSKQEIKDKLDAYTKKMEEEGKDDKKITYSDVIGTMMSGVRTIINVISYLLIAFVSISLVVSSIMIGIITYVSVLERTKEIGILRSIGASRKNISQVFNAETVIIGFISGLMGVVVTALLCVPASTIIKAITGVPDLAKLPLLAAIILICISVFLSFIAGLIPAGSASKKDPVIALRSE